jgi:hypothetical protein
MFNAYLYLLRCLYLFVVIKSVGAPSGWSASCSQEIWNNSFVRDNWRALIGKEDVERGVQLGVNFHERGSVTASIAVVWSRPNGNKVSVLEPMFVSIHDKLMSSSDESNIIYLIKFEGYS